MSSSSLQKGKCSYCNTSFVCHVKIQTRNLPAWYYQYCAVVLFVPSVLWRCWLGGRKGIRPVKKWVLGYWHGYLSGARCRLAYGPADATALTVSCSNKIQIGFTFLVPAHPGSPGKRAVKRVCVCCCAILQHSWGTDNGEQSVEDVNVCHRLAASQTCLLTVMHRYTRRRRSVIVAVHLGRC